MTCTHEFIVLDVQEDQLWPKMGALRGLDDLGDVDTRYEELEVLHDCEDINRSSRCHRSPLTLLRPVFAVEDGELREDTHLRTCQRGCTRNTPIRYIRVPAPSSNQPQVVTILHQNAHDVHRTGPELAAPLHGR